MKLDLAVLKLLKLDPSTTSVSSAGGGGCSSATTSKIITKLEDGTEKHFFMKTGRGKDAEIMFEGIHNCICLQLRNKFPLFQYRLFDFTFAQDF
jgi:protein-ribulosamine 3-kinase